VGRTEKLKFWVPLTKHMTRIKFFVWPVQIFSFSVSHAHAQTGVHPGTQKDYWYGDDEPA